MALSTKARLMTLYDHILSIWEGKTPDYVDIYSDFYYQLFSDVYDKEEEE